MAGRIITKVALVDSDTQSFRSSPICERISWNGSLDDIFRNQFLVECTCTDIIAYCGSCLVR